ncbi:MAG: hypothetical protein P1V36_05805, partial [Planctomycetota bacterium]|nr:hypothetical protein [Planctomycetota bacterium]
SAGGSPTALARGLPRVTFGTQRAWFVFPIPGGVRALVPFSAEAGPADVVVELDGAKSGAAAFTVR